MTDINKAIAFAKECLKWEHTKAAEMSDGVEVFDGTSPRGFYLTTEDIQLVLTEFLGKRFFIQINRGTSSLFKWSVIVGLQNRLAGPKGIFDHGHGEGNDMLDAIFDACVAAVRLYPTA